HVQRVDVRESGVMEHGVINHGIMVAGQQHDRNVERAHGVGGMGQNVSGQAVAVKGVTGEKHDIGANLAGGFQNVAQAASAVAIVKAHGIVVIDVHVRGMDDDDLTIGG